MKEKLVKLLKLPLLPLQLFIHLLRGRSVRTATLRRVLYAFAMGGVLLSLFAGLFSLGLAAREGTGIAELWDRADTWIYVTVGGCALPYVALSVLVWSAAHRVLRGAPDHPLGALSGLEGMGAVVRVYFVTLAVTLFVVVLDLSLMGLVLLGAIFAVAATVIYAVFYLIILLSTLFTVLLVGDLGFVSTVKQIWHYLTLPRYLLEWQGGLVDRLDPDPFWWIVGGIIYVYLIPAALAAWVWVRRESFQPPPAAAPLAD